MRAKLIGALVLSVAAVVATNAQAGAGAELYSSCWHEMTKNAPAALEVRKVMALKARDVCSEYLAMALSEDGEAATRTLVAKHIIPFITER
jgi:hypothetical protein